MELLKQNQFIGIMSDQNVSAREGVFVDSSAACLYRRGLAVWLCGRERRYFQVYGATEIGKIQVNPETLGRNFQNGRLRGGFRENTQRSQKLWRRS